MQLSVVPFVSLSWKKLGSGCEKVGAYLSSMNWAMLPLSLKNLLEGKSKNGWRIMKDEVIINELDILYRI